MKKQVHDYVELTDDKILKAVHTILESHINSVETDLEFTPELIKQLDKARKEHLEGKSKSYTLEEVRESVLAKLKK
ncbi:MAG: hypothetical protein KF900_01225 [Bacteroidetes bacterium]|nr:hypothetical protein [Bacteroidota bacterium]